MPKRWEIRRQKRDKVEALAGALDISRLSAWILLNRGFETRETAEVFLNPSLEQLKPESPLKDMDAAIERLLFAVRQGQCIGIHGDYDVDGIAGTAVLARFFQELGLDAVTYLPHREREGYGMKPTGVESLKGRGADLIVAVDCGVADHEAARRAKELGLDMIVVDHHQIPDTLPEALAVINPLRQDCGFSFPELSGAGLAFYLLIELRARLREQGFFRKTGKSKKVSEPNLLKYLDMVVLGTVADVVGVLGANRVLVHFGLKELAATRRPGLKMLKKVADVSDRKLSYGVVAFYLAPRINAAGRMDEAEPGLRLMLTGDAREARVLAEELNNKNSIRQRVEERILREAEAEIESHPEWLDRRSLVVGGTGWHKGVIGIVASRLVDKYHRPAAVITFKEGMGKGSLRSIPGLHLYDTLKACSEHLVKFGGHSQAAGITIEEGRLDAFRESFEAAVSARTVPDDFEERLYADAEWPIARLDLDLVRDLEKFAPFGPGNPEPCLVARGVKVVHSRVLKDRHVLMVLREKDTTTDAIAFRMAEHLPERGEVLDVAYVPELDFYKGYERIRLRIKDFHRLGPV